MTEVAAIKQIELALLAAAGRILKVLA